MGPGTWIVYQYHKDNGNSPKDIHRNYSILYVHAQFCVHFLFITPSPIEYDPSSYSRPATTKIRTPRPQKLG